MIKHSLDMAERDIHLIFDYLFHKQCLINLEEGKPAGLKSDYTMSPLNPENPESRWVFESVKDGSVLSEPFEPSEMLRIAKKALFITNALRMRSVTCNLNFKLAYT